MTSYDDTRSRASNRAGLTRSGLALVIAVLVTAAVVAGLLGIWLAEIHLAMTK